MTARDTVVGALQAQTGIGLPLAGVRVIPYMRDLDPPAKPTVMVRIDEVVPSPFPQVWRIYRFALVLIPTMTKVGDADEELDALLEDVLYAVDQPTNDLTWSAAKRATFEDKYPAYEVTLDLGFNSEE